MTINIGREAGSTPRVKAVPRPADLVDPGISDQVSMLSDVMLSTSQSLMTTIPSSPEDFAFFQAQRTARPASLPDPADRAARRKPHRGRAPMQPIGRRSTRTRSSPIRAPAGARRSTRARRTLPEFKKTKIENNTMVVSVTPEQERGVADRGLCRQGARPAHAGQPRDRASLFTPTTRRLAAEALKTLFGRRSSTPAMSWRCAG